MSKIFKSLVAFFLGCPPNAFFLILFVCVNMYFMCTLTPVYVSPEALYSMDPINLNKKLLVTHTVKRVKSTKDMFSFLLCLFWLLGSVKVVRWSLVCKTTKIFGTV